MSSDHNNQISLRQATNMQLLHLDDEFVEQKVNRTIGQLHEQAIAVTSTSVKFERHQQQHKETHELNADTREQHTHRHILSR